LLALTAHVVPKWRITSEFVYYCIRRLKLDRNKLDNILSEYIEHAMNPETRTKRYNWEKWKM
jgi:hypothetical protein